MVMVPTASVSAEESGSAEEESWGDDDEGFGDDGDDFEFDVPSTLSVPSTQSPYLGVTGFSRTRAGLWLERISADPISTVRQSLDLDARGRLGTLRYVAALHGEYDLAYAFDDRYGTPTKDTYVWQVIPGEQYISVPIADVDLTLGRQIVAWGEGDVFSPLDLVNPRDLREPGLADLDDIRLAVLATRLGYFIGQHRFEVMVVHEGHGGLRPDPLAEYSPLRTELLNDPVASALLRDKTLRYKALEDAFLPQNWSVFARWLYSGHGLDLGFYGARVLDRQGTIELPPTEAFAQDAIDLTLVHKTYDVIGHSGAKPHGDWLFKWEGVYEHDRPQNLGSLGQFPPSLSQGQVDLATAMLGLTYSGWTDLVIGVEGTRSLLLSDTEGLLFPLDSLALAARVSYLMLRERLRLDAAITSFGDAFELGGLARIETTYSYVDGLKIGAALTHFQSGDEDEFGPFSGLDDLDQLIFKLRWDFTLL